MKVPAYLVLGGGRGQLRLIRQMKELGIRVVLQDRNPLCTAAPLADEFVTADTRDATTAADAAKRYRVDAVLTAGTDQPVLTAAQAAAARGCPSFLSEETARAVTDKEIMKTTLVSAGLPVPRFRFAGPNDGIEILRGLQAPYVVKPVDSQGQRGVLRIEKTELFPVARDEALEWSNRKRIIVEEYHPNREITVSGWVHHGRVKIWAVTDRVTKDFLPHIGICLAHRYPSAYASGRLNETKHLVESCTATLGIQEGPLYYQFLVTDEGILINETAARLGGAYEDESLPPVCGVDPVGILINGSVNGSANPDNADFAVPINASAFAVPLMFCNPGTIAFHGSIRAVRSLTGVTAFDYLLPPKTVIETVRNSVQRAAYMVVHGPTTAAVNGTLKKAIRRTAILNFEGRNLLRNTLGYTLNPK